MTKRSTGWRSLLVLAVALMMIAAACASGSDDSSDGDGDGNGNGSGFLTGEPQQGGKLRYGVEAEASGLNPTSSRFAASAYLMGNAVFDRIARLDENGEYSPYLAESIEPNADLTEWTVTLRPDIVFHDGTPLTSEALALTLELAIADPLVGIAIKPLFRAENPVEIVDELTARYYMAEPNAHFPLYSTSQVGFIASPTWLRAAAENPDLNQEPVGTGPFIIKKRTQDSSTVFERNPDWWNGDVYLDEIEYVVQTDSGRRADQLRAGELDVLHTTSFSVIKTLRDDPDITTVEDDTGEEGFVMINTEAEPFDDVRVREALALATPKENYLEIITEGIGTPANSMFHPDLKWNNPDVKQQADQPKKAKALAAEYCADVPQNCEGDRIKMQFKYTGPDPLQDLIADTMVDGWQDAFVIERDQVLQDDYIFQVAGGDYQVVTWRQYGGADPEAEFVWHDCRNITPALSINWTRNCNEDTQRLMLEQRSSTDEDERIEAWHKIAENMNDDHIYIFLNHTNWMFAAQSDVGGGLDSDFPEGDLTAVHTNGSHSVSQMWLKQ